MNIRVGWDNAEKTIIRYIYGQDWTWEEFYTIHQQGASMVGKVSHTVHAILEVERNQRAIKDSLIHIKNILRRMPRNCGIVVIVSDDPMVEALLFLIRRVGFAEREKFLVAVTVDEAREIIYKHTSNS